MTGNDLLGLDVRSVLMCVQLGQPEGFADLPSGQGGWFTKRFVLPLIPITDCQNKNAQNQVLSLHFRIMKLMK